MTATTAPLPGDYLDPAQYALDLWTVAWPHATEDEIRADVDEYLAEPNGIARMQRAVADDPRAAVPDWMRGGLRDHAAKGGE